MCAARRTNSMRLTRLAARASPYHNAVTLYQEVDSSKPAVVGPSSTPSRRSRRIKQEPTDQETPSSLVSVPHDPEHPQQLEAHSRSRTVPDAARQKRRKVKTEQRDDSELVEAAGDASRASPKKKPVSSRSKSVPRRALDIPHPAPLRWAEAYALIKDMRAHTTAPVDTMGCDQAQWKEQDPKNQRFATLVSLMLSSQTKDEVTDAAVGKLRTALGGSLSVQAMLEADDGAISEAIAKVGFWRRKTQYIKQTAQRLHDDFDDDVPNTVEELCSLPGVGPKMAYLALQVAWKLNVGIGVDVHVHRITNRLGWHARQTRNPEETRLNLESWLPKELHGEINHLLVGFGQTICLPVGPKCHTCALSEGDLCPSARNAGTKSSKVRKAAIGKRSSSKSETSVGEGDGEGSGPKMEMEMEMPTWGQKAAG